MNWKMINSNEQRTNSVKFKKKQLKEDQFCRIQKEMKKRIQMDSEINPAVRITLQALQAMT